MKSEHCFLALPVMATLLNVLMLLVLITTPHETHGQPILQQQQHDASLGGRCLDSSNDQCQGSFLIEQQQEQQLQDNNKDEPDPQLASMPGYDFQAYVRADISSFYQQAPGTRTEQTPDYKGQAGKFVNMSPLTLDLYWESSQGGKLVQNDVIGPWQAGGTATFPGHVFVYTLQGKPDSILCRMKVVPGVSVYYCDPYQGEHATTDPRARGDILQAGYGGTLASLSSWDHEQYQAHTTNFEFAAEYKNFTKGSEWLTMYPKDPPRNKIWRADYFGQEHVVTTPHTQFAQIPPHLSKLDRTDLKHLTDAVQSAATENNSTGIAYPEYRYPGDHMNITVKALSVAPRSFEVRNFLSDAEVDHLVELVNRKTLDRSTTNGHLSETRTSSTTWVGRDSDVVMDAIFRRVADTLRMDEALLRDRVMGEPTPQGYADIGPQRINEDLQIVHYGKGQQYTAHHDFGYPKGKPGSPSRSINFCMYLRDVEEGGETSFPRWRNAETGEAISVKPEKGKAMIFYMVNPDGNLDDLTHHAALPVIQGEKLFSNLWIWDPVRSSL